ncbi:hypothetical protein P152DRAFT_454676 [Eremomyces bilateralis CBS 781.70]|uniref:SnoaL-like domain-containing protein n=1 Tax=Eremomyces bilateralis CBS 781.70 TaxID=1392243 RepID=A0A6G1GE79_9PEZI|nr:uncharacterized protein P152DRAFT_454676 [Eremomyces bilateralis CBS 781.70]KAF1816407.1 hypothetical protein P152DRAFT_454676 [Eremomyces bilateralis CBS 781.70]
MALSYKIECAPVSFDESFQAFFENFYRISDDPTANNEYVKQFTENATLIMASKRLTGSSEIQTFRQGMWEKIGSRHHKAAKLFPYGSNASEAMLYGTVDYVLKDGQEINGVEWAARAHLVKEGDAVKMDFYQVYLDSAAQKPPK